MLVFLLLQLGSNVHPLSVKCQQSSMINNEQNTHEFLDLKVVRTIQQARSQVQAGSTARERNLERKHFCYTSWVGGYALTPKGDGCGMCANADSRDVPGWRSSSDFVFVVVVPDCSCSPLTSRRHLTCTVQGVYLIMLHSTSLGRLHFTPQRPPEAPQTQLDLLVLSGPT